ncbi:MAG: aspartate aminotransferase family protein [Burkholderiaceae bacterium]
MTAATRQVHRDLRRMPAIATHAQGAWIDAGGRRFLDACGGAAVMSVGHGHPDVLDAMRDQIGRVSYLHSSFFTSAASEQLADRLASMAPRGLEAAMFVSSGSEAVESALKLARQSAVELGERQRTVVVSRRASYHGNTLGALAVGGHAGRRRIYEPWLNHVEFVDPCYQYRGLRPGEREADYSARLVADFEELINRIGGDRVLAFVAETVVGATLGAVPPTAGYFRGIREVCDRYGILLLLDEVMCGSGRTGSFFAFEQEGVVPDLSVLAKGLGGGYVPISAVMAGPRVLEPVRSGSAALANGFTCMGHPLACGTALAVLEVMERERLLENVQRRGTELLESLAWEFRDHPHVGDVRGRGLFVGIEFVADRDTKTPYETTERLASRLKDAAMDEELLVYAGTGTADGIRGDHLLIAPPYTASSAEIGQIVERLSRAVGKV